MMAILTSGMLHGKPKTLIREEIDDQYKWNLTDIYPDWNAWQADYEKLEKMMNDLAAMKGTLNSGPEKLLEVLKLQEEIDLISTLIYRYPQLTRDTDTRNTDISAKFQQVMILLVETIK